MRRRLATVLVLAVAVGMLGAAGAQAASATIAAV
jgi:hypothetical protein